MIENQNENIVLKATTSESSNNENSVEKTTNSDQDKISNNLDEPKPKTSIKLEEKVEVKDEEISQNKTGWKMKNEVLEDFQIDFNELPEDLIVDKQAMLQAENSNDKQAENLAAESYDTEEASVEVSEIEKNKSVQTQGLTRENSAEKSEKLEESPENDELHGNQSAIKKLPDINESNSKYSLDLSPEEIQTDIPQNMEEVLEQEKEVQISKSESETTELFELNLDETNSEKDFAKKINTQVRSDTLSTPRMPGNFSDDYEKTSNINTKIESKE